MIRESFFDRQRQLRRMTVWLLMLTVIGAIGNALTGGFVSLLAYQYDSTGPQSFSATMSMGQAFAMGATLMVVLVALITLGQYVALRILSGGARRFFAARDLCTDNEVARLELAERQLVNVVQEMAIAASVRPPHVYLTEDPAINSFALITAGAQPVVGVSRGSLTALSRDELQAMVAHEIAHLANGDARINLGLLSLVRGFSSIYDFSAGVIRAPMRAFAPNRFSWAVTLLLVVYLWPLLAIGSVGRMNAVMMQAAIARRREFLADASALQFLRYEQALIAALEKAQASHATQPHRPAQLAAFMMFVAPGKDRFRLWRSHPRIDQRIAAIRAMQSSRSVGAPRGVVGQAFPRQ